MKILLIGANGQLGRDLMAALAHHDVLGTARGTITANDSETHRLSPIALDVCDAVEVRATIAGFSPDIVINCAAYHRVDDIESDASQALAVNALAAQRLALTCRELDAALLHVSTDYVFDGAKRAPYVETDPPNPLSAYGTSKLAGELLIRAAWRKHYIVRTCGLYGLAGASGKGGNFVNTMLRLAQEGKPIRVVNDQTCTPTFTKDLAQQIARLIETEAYGVYHITNAGACTWYEFACEAFRLAGLRPDARPITSAEFNAPARRPPYSVLENAALRALGIDQMRHWREALAEYVSLKMAQG
ncbi:MAG: dTDP-4-dehydrorhamnose reductase [Thermoflexales bacterium]